jgi:hypothetical protein
MPARMRTIFTPGARTKITLLTYKRRRWTGRRGGILLRFQVIEPTLSGKSIRWEAKLDRGAPRGVMAYGEAYTVADAMDAIERQAAQV